MKKYRVSKIGKFIAYIAILLCAVLLFGVIGYFTSGFTTTFKTFYVVYENKVILQQEENLQLRHSAGARFNVRYTLSFLNEDMPHGFDIKIIPNKDFNFTVDGETYSFGVETDLTSCFDIQAYEDYFILTVPRNMEEALGYLYPDSEIIVPELLPETDYFSMVISSYNGESSVIINFSIYNEVEGIDIDTQSVVF